MNRFQKSRLALSMILIVGMLSGQHAYGETSIAVNEQAVQQNEEVLEFRTENSKTFKTDQPGVYVRKVFAEQAHYRGEDDQFYEISTDLTDENQIDSIKKNAISSYSTSKFIDLKKSKEAGKKEGKTRIHDTNGYYYAFHVPFNAELPQNITSGYSITKGEDTLSFIPLNAKASIGEKDPLRPNTVLYENVWDFSHIKLSVTPTGVKEDIILLNEQAPNSFTFEVKGTLDKDMKSGELTLLPAWLEDHNGQIRTVNTIKRLMGNKTYLDLTWDDEGLVYPITIDPSVSSQRSNAYHTCSSDPNVLNEGLAVGLYPNMGRCMSFLQFTNFQLPKSAQVTKVDLKVHGYHNYTGQGAFPVTVRQLFAPLTMQLNYNNPPEWLDSKSVTSILPYTSKYETYRWSNLGIDTGSFRAGFVQLGMYYTSNLFGMLYEAASGYGGEAQLEITFIDTTSIYHYDLSGKLSSIRTKTGHLASGTIYDKNGNTLKRLAPYYTLLENHDFREGGAKWKLGPNMSTSNEMSVDGNGSLKFSSIPAIASRSVAQSYAILTGSANSYILTADILDNTTSGKVYVTWKEYNLVYGEVGSGSQLLTTIRGQWTKKSISFATGHLTSWIVVQIVAEAGTKGTAHVDFLNLMPGIANGGFDNGKTDWYGSSTLTVSSHKAMEGTSLRFQSASLSSASISSNKKIPINPGRTYNLSAWFYNDFVTANGKITIIIQQMPEDGPPIDTQVLVVSEQRGTGEWFNKDINVTTNKQARYITIQIMFSDAAGNAYIDKMQFVPN